MSAPEDLGVRRPRLRLPLLRSVTAVMAVVRAIARVAIART
jgi:hypothetical protein